MKKALTVSRAVLGFLLISSPIIFFPYIKEEAAKTENSAKIKGSGFTAYAGQEMYGGCKGNFRNVT